LVRQVLIEVLVAKVTLTGETTLGIEQAVRNGRYTLTNTQTSFPNTQTGAGPSLPPPGLIPGGGSLGGALVPAGVNMFTFAANELITALNALATENKVNVLSSPSIRTSENKKAVLTQIGEQGTVSLDVKEEVNDVREAELSPINSPRIKNREADTSVVLLKARP
jgi:type II secretory pathway component GspD/PulD (secretin)